MEISVHIRIHKGKMRVFGKIHKTKKLYLADDKKKDAPKPPEKPEAVQEVLL
jgi:hypothetical protein